MGCTFDGIQNVSFQMKNIEMQFINFMIQTKNFGLQNTVYQTQELGFQMINIGIQLLNIFTTMSNNINTFMIKKQIQNMITQIQNIEMKINLKNENVMDNNMMMKNPNMVNIFENNNQMGNIIERSDENSLGLPYLIPHLNQEVKETIKYNITFIQQTGKRTVLVLDKEITIKEMIELYLNKIGKKLEDIKDRPFLYNGQRLDIFSKQNIEKFFEQNAWIYSPF